jgi:proline dehydrogenase
MYAGAKGIFFALSRSAALKRLASKYGMRSRDSFARRFIAGETVEEAIDTSRRVQSEGLHLTLDYLGESVRTSEEATPRHAHTSACWTSSWLRASSGTSP